MFTVSYSCRVEIMQNLPDNAKIKTLEQLSREFKRMLEENEHLLGMDIKISDTSLKTSVPFD